MTRDENNNREKTPLSEADDLTLVRKARGNDLAAYDELVRRYQGKIYGLIYNMTSNKEDTEDLVQDVFVKAFKSLGRFREKSAFFTWLYRIAINQTINYVKKRKKRASLSLDDEEVFVEKDETYMELSSRDTPFRDATLADLKEKLNKALKTLSEKHRIVVVLHDIQGVPHEDIGNMLGCSPGTVRSRLFYARQHLQAELSEYAP